MNKTFQVPVWFNVQAENAYEAEMKVSSFLQPVIFPNILETEKPDAVLHFTDPRYWIWLYQMEYAVEDAIEIEEID